MILLNGEAHDLAAGTTVACLVEQVGCGFRGVAVAVNGELVPRSAWSRHRLREGDRVEVLGAARGG